MLHQTTLAYILQSQAMQMHKFTCRYLNNILTVNTWLLSFCNIHLSMDKFVGIHALHVKRKLMPNRNIAYVCLYQIVCNTIPLHFRSCIMRACVYTCVNISTYDMYIIPQWNSTTVDSTSISLIYCCTTPTNHVLWKLYNKIQQRVYFITCCLSE